MRNHRAPLARRDDRPAAIIESLEPRLLLSGSWTGADVDGDALTVTLAGPGAMTIVEGDQGAGEPRIKSIELSGVEDDQSKLTIKVTKDGGDGFVDVGTIFAYNTTGLQSINAPTTDLLGDAGAGIDVQGYVAAISLHNIADGVSVRAKQGSYFFPAGAKTTFTAWDLGQHVTVELGSWLDSVKVHSWGLAGWLVAKGLTKLDVAGDSGAGISVFRGPTGSINIGGAVLATENDMTTWFFPADVGTITVGSGQAGWNTNAGQGTISTFTCKGDMSGSIMAVSLGALTVAGDMPTGSLALIQPVDPVKKCLGSATIGGAVGDADTQNSSPQWTLIGNAGTITVGQAYGDWIVNSQGAIKSLTSKGDLSFAMFQAVSLGTLSVAGDMGVGQLVLMQQADPAKPALGSATIGGQVAADGQVVWSMSSGVGAITVGGSTPDWQLMAPDSTIASLTCKGDLSFGVVDALSLGTLSVKGNMPFGTLHLGLPPDSPAKKTLGAATVGGSVGDGDPNNSPMEWIIGGYVGSITVGSAYDDWGLGTQGTVASLTSKGDLAFSHFEALSLGSLKVAGNLASGALSLTQPADPKKLALGSATIGGRIASGAVATWTLVGNVGPITAGSAGATWTVNSQGDVKSLTVSGDLAVTDWYSLTLGTLKVGGSWTGGNLRLTSTNTSLTSATIAGWMRNSMIRAAGNIGSLKVKGMDTATVAAGVNPLDDNDTAYSATARIGSLTVTGPATIQQPDCFFASSIRAGIVGTVSIASPGTQVPSRLDAFTIPSGSIKLLAGNVTYTFSTLAAWQANNEAWARLQVYLVV